RQLRHCHGFCFVPRNAETSGHRQSRAPHACQIVGLAAGDFYRHLLIEVEYHARTATNPRSPSTRMRAPSGIREVAWSVPTTAGIPNSRATMAEWLSVPPRSV